MKRFSLLIGLGAVVVLLLFVYLLFNGLSVGQRQSVEVARIPRTDVEVVGGTVLPSDEALLIGLDYPLSTTMNQKFAVVLASNKAYRKILIADPCRFPQVATPMRGSITRDGRRLLLGSSRISYKNLNPPLHVADIHAGRWLYSNSTGPDVGMSWNPLSQDGSRFLGERRGAGQNGLYLHDTSTGKPLLSLTKGLPVNSTLSDYGFLPGCREVQYVENSRPARRLWRVRATGRKPRLMGEISGTVRVYTSPDGSRLAVVRDYATSLGRKRVVLGQIGLMSSNCKYLGPLYTMAKDEDIIHAIWSPDGRFIAVHLHPGDYKSKLPFIKPKPRYNQVMILYVPAGKVVARLKNPKHDLMPLDWYPDSKAILCGYQDETEMVLQKLTIR